jgi:riboflavin kinase/FMN adenylyltransferase
MPAPPDAPDRPRTAVTIGTFDGAHAGHAALIDAARSEAGPGGRVVVLSFDPHPASALPGRTAPPRLTGFARRAERLRAYGADEVRRLEPGPDLLGLSPEAFMAHVVESFDPDVIVEGPDFRFGRGRSGTAEGLREIGTRLGFEVHIVDPVEVDLGDQTLTRASSTMVRWLLEHGRVRDAARVIGRGHGVEGTVVPGDRLGRTIGIPTMNVKPTTVLPADGVYAARAHLPGGRTLAAAVNVGSRPTVDGPARRIEAHVLGLPTSLDTHTDGDATTPWAPIAGLDEYGWATVLEPLAWVREQVRFDGLDQLRAQIRRDVARVPDLLASVDLDRAPQPSPEVHA